MLGYISDGNIRPDIGNLSLLAIREESRQADEAPHYLPNEPQPAVYTRRERGKERK